MTVHAVNRKEGREIGSDASDLPGVSEIAERTQRTEGNGSGALPKTAPEFRLRGELLEKRDRAGNEWKIVLPTAQAQHAVLHSAHHALEGHASHNAMLREVSRRYWWKGMQESCIRFVDHCEHCQRTKSHTQRSFGTMVCATLVCLRRADFVSAERVATAANSTIRAVWQYCRFS